MQRLTKALTAAENLDIGLSEGNALLVQLTGTTTPNGTVDFQSTLDGVTYANTPYIEQVSITASKSVTQLSSITTVTTYIILPPVTQVRIKVASLTSGTITVTYREIKYSSPSRDNLNNLATYIISDNSSPGAIALTANPGVAFRLLRVELLLSAAPTTSENFTVTLDAGDGALFDVVQLTRDLSVGSVTSLSAIFGKGYEFESDDESDIAYTNTDAGDYGCRIVVEKI